MSALHYTCWPHSVSSGEMARSPPFFWWASVRSDVGTKPRRAGAGSGGRGWQSADVRGPGRCGRADAGGQPGRHGQGYPAGQPSRLAGWRYRL